MALPTIGTVSYNGVEFDARSRTHISCRPVPDKAGRTVKLVEITLNVEGWISGDPTDGTMLNLRRKLTENGKPLQYVNKGFGDLSVNVDRVKDVQWGPWPTLLEYDPVGSNQAARVKWQCTVRIPECEKAKFTTLPLEFSYAVEYTIDQDAYTTIRVDGEITIPMTRKQGNDRTIPDSVDRLREKCFPDVPLSFQRGPHTWRLSDDKRTASFGYTDTEIPVPLPNGATRCDIRHRTRAARAENGGFARWHGSISGSITMARGEPKAEGYKRFLMICNTVIGNIRSTNVNAVEDHKEADGSGNGYTITVVKPFKDFGLVMLTSVSIDDDLFGRSCSYSMEYAIIGTTIDNFVKVAGHFRHLGLHYAKWADSLRQTAFHPRGFARLKHEPSKEAIIDLCIGKEVAVAPGVAGKQKPKKAQVKPDHANTKPDPATSWIHFDNRLAFKEDEGIAAHIPIGADHQEKQKPNADKVPEQVKADQAPSADVTTRTDTLLQTVRAPIYRVWMIGSAVRLGHEITPPELKVLAGAKPTLGKREVVKGEIRKIGDVLMYGCRWRLEYLFSTPPKGNISAPANPFQTLEDSGRRIAAGAAGKAA